MRVHEIAKKWGMSTKELIGVLKTLKIPASNHMSALSDEQAQTLHNYLKAQTKTDSEKTKISPVKKGKAKSPAATPPLLETATRQAQGGKKSPQGSSAPLVPTPPLASPKKGFILVKKKKETEPVPPPLAVTDITPPQETLPAREILAPPAPIEEEIPSSEAPLISLPHPEEPVVSKPVFPYYQKEDAEGLQPVQPVPSPSHAVDDSPEEKKEKGEKKKKITLVEDVKPDPRKGLRTRSRGKEGKGGSVPLWDSSQVLTEEPAIGGRKWLDFRPTHKRQAPKAKSPSPVVDITKPRRKIIKLYEGLTLKEFSELVGTKVSVLISKLIGYGKMLTANQPIPLEEALFLSEELGIKAELVSDKTEEEILRPLLPVSGDSQEKAVPRPPVITIMGHVDHGKTSLLDAIRRTKVQEGESGGITQHIGAYTVTVHDRAVTFLDTPGHEAFTAMRARGAKVTDIVVLVIAADDGVMPQTVEAINHAKAANVPIVVAINKIDTPEANPERIKTALVEYGLIPEAWGGQTIFVEVSAKQKIGLEHFLEMILLQADILELKGNPDGWMEGIVIEAKLSRGHGPVATVLVQQGTLRVGDAFVAGVQAGRVRALINDMGDQVKEASLSMPVEVIGFPGVPSAGDTFLVTEDERVAKDVAQDRMHRQRISTLAQLPRVTLQSLSQHVKAGNVEELRLVIKADVQGSVGALVDAIEKLSTAAVTVRVIHKGVGGITESDVLLASASNAIVIGFHVRPNPVAALVAEREKIDIRLYDIIYDALEDVKKAMEGMLAPTLREKVTGRAEVRQTFQIPKVGMICGCYVSSGIITRSGSRVHVLRDQVVIHDGKLSSLRRFKDDVKEVQTGFECGIGIESFNDMKVGDVLEVYIQEEVAARL